MKEPKQRDKIQMLFAWHGENFIDGAGMNCYCGQIEV
jgi:hypothetical protein